jgi:predicted DNA-binding transcriptional regulator AlpA
MDIAVSLNARSAAALLGVSLRRFQQLRWLDAFPVGRRLGPKQVRWLLPELLAWLAAQPVVRCQPEPAQLARARRTPVGDVALSCRAEP